MKYILICTAALIVCFAVGFVLSKLILKSTKSKKGLKTTCFTALFGIVLMAAVTVGYLAVYHHAEPRALEALKGNEAVTVTKIDGGYFFDGNGTDTALVFYAGAKVENKAYSALMLGLAENGVDCFLADLPFNFAIFGKDTADKFINNYQYETVIMAGHSMGGLMASQYATENTDKVDMIVLLGAYSKYEVSDNISLLSIYGTNDLCIDKAEYDPSKANWPVASKEYIIDGANHAQFGDYGTQSVDGVATISAEEQQSLTVTAIIDFIKENGK